MRVFDAIRRQVHHAGLALLARAIAIGAPGQYTTPG
jgi:hypothetical protein